MATALSCASARPSGSDGTAAGRRASAMSLVAHASLVAALLAAVGLFGVAALPRAFGYGTLVVLSGSMGRAAPVGSLVVTAPTPAPQIRVGDAIVVPRHTTGGRTVSVLHRVIALEDRDGHRIARLKGDANHVPDTDPAPLEGPVQRVVRVLPTVGYVVAFLGAYAKPLPVLGLVGGLLLLRLIWAPRPRRRSGA